MTDRFGFGILISIILVIGVLSAGCSGDTQSAGTPVPTATPIEARYVAGDIVATQANTGASSLYLILQYDKGTDLYTRAFIEKNADGSWGYRSNNRTETSPRTVVEKVYPVKVAHVSLSSVPIVTMTIPPVTVTTSSASAPIVRGISPVSGARDAVVSVTINGTNFQSGATVRLVQPGNPPLSATGVSVTSTEIGKVPVVVGVPVMTPGELRLRPGGSGCWYSVHVRGATPVAETAK